MMAERSKEKEMEHRIKQSVISISLAQPDCFFFFFMVRKEKGLVKAV